MVQYPSFQVGQKFAKSTEESNLYCINRKYYLIVVCTWESWTVIIDVLNIYNNLCGVGIGWAAKILGSNDQFV